VGKKYFKAESVVPPRTESPSSPSSTLNSAPQAEDQSSLTVYADLIALVLEIINAALIKNLVGNPNLIYSLLLQQDLISQFRASIKFQGLVENLDTVAAHFQGRIHEAGLDGAGYDEVLSLIRKEGRVWQATLKEVAVISFKYEEEKNADEFFHPLVWGMVVQHPSLSWSNTSALPLFVNFIGTVNE